MQNQEKRTYKIIAISDTHGSNDQIQKLITNKQKGDIFIHAGDFTRCGREQQFQSFISLLKQLDFKHKIVVAGNHQISLDNNMDPKNKSNKLQKYPCKYSRQQLLNMLNQNCIYLQHQMIQLEGIRIFGSPYTKKYGRGAFQYQAKYEQSIWNQIPNVDILITHSPPFKILDKADSGKFGGSQYLKKKVFEIKPKLHLFGHIHEGRGQLKIQGIQFINLAKQMVRLQFQM